MGKRLLAVAVVIASACTALHYTTMEQKNVVVSDNGHVFMPGETHTFIVSSAQPDDDDMVTSIYLSGCTTQWRLDTNVDPQGIPGMPGPEVCGPLAPTAVPNTGMCPRTYMFNVHFYGTIFGPSSCNVYISAYPIGGSGSAMSGSFAMLMLTGNGSGATGITVSPSGINFGGQQYMMTGSANPVTVKNNNTMSTTTISGSLTGMGSAFIVNPPLANSYGIGPGSQMVFQVSCRPPMVGPYSALLSFSDGSSSGSTQLDCLGIDSMVNIQPTNVTFASTLVGRRSGPKTVHISGNSAALIQSVTRDQMAIDNGVQITMNPQGMLVGGSGRDVELHYDAPAMHASGPLGTLSIKVDVDSTSRPIGLNGEALLGGIGTNPASVEFGAVCAGDTMMKDVEVYASEPGNVQLMSLVRPEVPFDATSSDIPKMLQGNHNGTSATVKTTYSPAMPGDYKGTIAITHDIPNVPNVEIQTHGIALAEGIAATPDVLHFGTTGTDTTTGIQEVQFTNCSKSDLMYNGAALTGANQGEFALVGQNLPKKLKPTESEVFMIIMQPESSGFKMAQLVINHDQGTTTVNLDGTGEGGAGKDRETYYACSTGRGAALWPIGIALLALRRRRRIKE